MKKKYNRQEHNRLFRYSLKTNLVIFVFMIFCVTNLMVSILYTLITNFHILPLSLHRFSLSNTLLLFVLSILLGTCLTTLVGQQIFIPIKQLIEGTKEVAAGNFDVHIEVPVKNEVGKLAESFNMMAKELGGIETLRADFINNISHEFKTPAASIKGFAKLLKKDTVSEENKQEYLDIIISEAERLAKLSGNVLLLSNLNQQEQVDNVELFPLDEQIRRTILLLEPQTNKKKIGFEIDMAPVDIRGNYDLLNQVWINLINNAVKFTPEGGTIYVSLRKNNEHALVTIRDTGMGMDGETAKYIFDKFYQGDPSRTTEGNGLGLSIARRIVQLSGGDIRVDSKIKEGAAFFIRLPFHNENRKVESP